VSFPSCRVLIGCTEAMEQGGYHEGRHGREGNPFSWVVQDGEKREGVLSIVVC
jgi:hypothetical protein